MEVEISPFTLDFSLAEDQGRRVLSLGAAEFPGLALPCPQCWPGRGAGLCLCGRGGMEGSSWSCAVPW